MHRQIIDIIICDQSDMLKFGLVEILKKNSQSDFPVKLCNNIDEVNHYLKITSTQILIASPDFLNSMDLKKYSFLKTVALVYAYYNPQILKKYDGVIHFNETGINILNLLNSLIKSSIDEPENSKVDELLTTREKEILKLLVSGSLTKEISDQLFISIHTVNNHRKNIIRKLGISTISGLTIYAVINKIIDPKKIMQTIKK